MKKFLTSRTVDFWILLVTGIIGIVGGICYALTGTDQSQMTETFMSPLVLIIILVMAVLNIVSMFLKASLIRMLTAVGYFGAIVAWAVNQGGYIVNVMMGLDGNSFSPAYIFAVVAMVIGFIASLTAGIMQMRKEK